MRFFRPVKISIIGAGYVGAATAFALQQSGLASELVLVDIDQDKVRGEMLDLSHASSLGPPQKIIAGQVQESRDSNIIIFTAGANQKPGQTRLDLVRQNSEIVKKAIPEIVANSPDAVLIMVTNPVDILTYVAYQASGFQSSRVIGSGTVLDSARFRRLLANRFNIDPRNIHAYVLGEHGDSEVPVWSTANIAGVNLDNFLSLNTEEEVKELKEKINEEVRQAADEIIKLKGATAYGVAAALVRICEAILRNENAVLTVSSLIEGVDEKVDGVFLSLPCIVNSIGMDKILKLPLENTEMEAIRESALTLKTILKEIGYL